MRVLTVNAGSSSLRLALLEQDTAALGGFSVRAGYDDLAAALDDLRDDPPDTVGHRVVHGGSTVPRAAVAGPAVVAALEDLTPLAPLHQPAALAVLRELSAAWPSVPQVVCPDTAFHSDLPPAAATPALPKVWRERWGLRRYGFHGLSLTWAAQRVRLLHPRARRVVVAHLGAGASVTALLDGRSVDTTMGFTPLDGLVMATRSGSLDPGLVLWVVRQGLDPVSVADDLESRSGLLALTGTADMQEVLARRAEGDQQAMLGLDVYVHRLGAQLGAMVAGCGGLDVLVLTGGVAERSWVVRAAAAAALEHLGVRIDDGANEGLDPPDDVADIAATGSSAPVLVLAAREDLVIARQALDEVGPRSRRSGP